LVPDGAEKRASPPPAPKTPERPAPFPDWMSTMKMTSAQMMTWMVRAKVYMMSSYIVGSAATPGSVFPSRNSKEAPPPVDIWVI